MRSKCVRIFPRIVTGWRQLLSNWAWHSGALQPPFRGATTRGRVLQGKHRPRGVKGSSCRVSRQKSRPSYRHADLRAAKVKKKEKKNWERSGLFTVLFLFFVLRKEKEKTHSFFFFFFSLQPILPSFYVLRINGERKIGLILVWLRTKSQFCSVWRSPGVQHRGPSFSCFKFSLRDMNPKKSSLGWWGTEGQSFVTSSMLTRDSETLSNQGHRTLAQFY